MKADDPRLRPVSEMTINRVPNVDAQFVQGVRFREDQLPQRVRYIAAFAGLLNQKMTSFRVSSTSLSYGMILDFRRHHTSISLQRRHNQRGIYAPRKEFLPEFRVNAANNAFATARVFLRAAQSFCKTVSKPITAPRLPKIETPTSTDIRPELTRISADELKPTNHQTELCIAHPFKLRMPTHAFCEYYDFGPPETNRNNKRRAVLPSV